MGQHQGAGPAANQVAVCFQARFDHFCHEGRGARGFLRQCR
jgi:hypothetical protein